MSLILSGTDGLSDVDGSAATPAIRGTDANTGIFFPAADTIAFSEGGVEAMRIDSSGNVGIGTVSPVQLGTGPCLTINKNGDDGIRLRSADTNYSMLNFGLATGGSTYLQSTATGSGTTLPFAFYVGSTERMRIDTSGNVGIGTSSPGSKLQVSGIISSIGSGTSIFAAGETGTYTLTGVTSPNYGIAYGTLTGRSNPALTVSGYDAIAFGTSQAERARIDSSGNLLVGTTSSSFGEKLSVQSTASGTNIAYLNYTYTDDRSNTVIQHSRATGATSATMILFRNASSSQVGLISSTGSATTYTTSSDYRLKENIQPMTGALATVAQLNPVTYTWKDGGFVGQGFIAHELQEVVPDAVVGEKNAVDEDGNPKYQGIDTSFLVATLTAAIQELKALVDTQASTITTLTDRITALETPTGTQA